MTAPVRHAIARRAALVAFMAACAFLAGERGYGAEPAHFHHVRLNVTDVDRSIEFYTRVFGATRVRFNGLADALFTERSFILFNQVASPAPSSLTSSLWHIGWGGVDVKNEFAWWRDHDVDIHTPLSPLPGKDNYYFYMHGPDRELIEINTMGHHRFAHVHLFASDVNATCDWFATHLGLSPRRASHVPKPAGDMSSFASIWINTIQCDNVSIIVFGKPDIVPPPPWWRDPPLKNIEPTQGRVIDHIAFSYDDIDPVHARMAAAGARSVSPIETEAALGLRGFTVLAPDGLLVRIVEAAAIPEGLWQVEAPRDEPRGASTGK